MILGLACTAGANIYMYNVYMCKTLYLERNTHQDKMAYVSKQESLKLTLVSLEFDGIGRKYEDFMHQG